MNDFGAYGLFWVALSGYIVTVYAMISAATDYGYGSDISGTMGFPKKSECKTYGDYYAECVSATIEYFILLPLVGIKQIYLGIEHLFKETACNDMKEKTIDDTKATLIPEKDPDPATIPRIDTSNNSLKI